jgi:hypothetical protein
MDNNINSKEERLELGKNGELLYFDGNTSNEVIQVLDNGTRLIYFDEDYGFPRVPGDVINKYSSVINKYLYGYLCFKDEDKRLHYMIEGKDYEVYKTSNNQYAYKDNGTENILYGEFLEQNREAVDKFEKYVYGYLYFNENDLSLHYIHLNKDFPVSRGDDNEYYYKGLNSSNFQMPIDVLNKYYNVVRRYEECYKLNDGPGYLRTEAKKLFYVYKSESHEVVITNTGCFIKMVIVMLQFQKVL